MSTTAFSSEIDAASSIDAGGDAFITRLLHIGVRAFAAFGDEAVDPRDDNGKRCRAELEHGLSPRDPLKC